MCSLDLLAIPFFPLEFGAPICSVVRVIITLLWQTAQRNKALASFQRACINYGCGHTHVALTLCVNLLVPPGMSLARILFYTAQNHCVSE